MCQGPEDTSSQPQDSLPHLLPRDPGPQAGRKSLPRPGPHPQGSRHLHSDHQHEVHSHRRGWVPLARRELAALTIPGSTRAWPSRPSATLLGSPPPDPGPVPPCPLPLWLFPLFLTSGNQCATWVTMRWHCLPRLLKKKEIVSKHISHTPYGCAATEHGALTLASSPLIWSNTRCAFISVEGL